ncbi:MAG: 3'-5' exonuclease, partial [Candidatus Methylomirabilales bacterium]
YRSTPQILLVANRLVPRMAGSSKDLRTVADPGPEPLFRQHPNARQEVGWIVEHARRLHEKAVPWEEMAVLYRINGRSEELEEALSAARIPYQVRDGAFLRRPAARSLMARLRRIDTADVAAAVERVVRDLGLREDLEAEGPLGEEATRQADLGRLLNLAREYPGAGRIPGFVADLQRRFAPEEQGRGIQLMTYHRAKGLEFEAVFLPRLEDKELPFVLAKSSEALAEERRLLYVGITRAKRFLLVSWAESREGERRRRQAPSPFLDEIRPPLTTAPRVVARREVRVGGADLFGALKQWRLMQARDRGVSAFVILYDRTLLEIVDRRPQTLTELQAVPGIGPAKVARYGEEILSIVKAHSAR